MAKVEKASKNNDIRFSKVKTDKDGNFIGDGSYNIEPTVYEFEQYPQVSSSISKSDSTESTYVKYYNKNNGRSVTVRFSNHENNAVKFGDQLDLLIVPNWN